MKPGIGKAAASAAIKVAACARANPGHPSRKRQRETLAVGGRKYSFAICRNCGARVDAKPVTA